MATDLVAGRYPKFVYGLDLSAKEAPPVFCFHDARPDVLEPLLQFLSDNDYQTLTCDDFYNHLTGAKPAPKRSILLTFDDGVGSMWTIAYPLLEKYHCKATVFLIPGRIQSQPDASLSPTLKDVWAKRVALNEVLQRDQSDQPLATWQEIHHMHASGHFDFQSHTLRHDRIIIDPAVMGFFTREQLDRCQDNDLTMYHHACEKSSYSRPLPGTPIYRTAPRMAEGLKVEEDIHLRHQLERYVHDHGGDDLLTTRRGQHPLHQFVAEYRRQHATSLRQETSAQRDTALLEDLGQAKHLIEQQLPGKSVRHLAFPWGIGSPAAVEAARQAGYISCFWGRVNGRLFNQMGTDPFHIARLGEMFTERLPGHGRRSLAHLLTKKLMKRLKL